MLSTSATEIRFTVTSSTEVEIISELIDVAVTVKIPDD